MPQNQLDIPRAGSEHVVQPASVADDLGGKAVAVARVGWGFHATSFAGPQLACQIRLP
jgi:hypothetical protein